MYRTYADEMKTGNVNAREFGSFVNSLDAGNRGEGTDPILGGTSGAEGTPAYSKLIENKEPQTIPAASAATTLFSKLTSPTALAATDTADTSGYLCNNGKPVPAGQLVCSEEILGIGSKYANLINEYLNNNPLGVSIVAIAQLWQSTIGQIFKFLNNIIGSVFTAIEYPLDKECDAAGLFGGVGKAINPNPYCPARDAVKKASAALVDMVTKWLIPNPFSTNMSGGRTFDMMAAGADVAGNDSAHTTLGGMQLSDQQVASIVNEQEQEQLQDYKSQGLAARLFNTDSDYSPVSKLAMAMPMNLDAAHHSVAGILSSPFGNIGHTISSIFSSRVLAAAVPAGDPFGVTQYGYTDAQIPEDPETYWDQHCADKPAQAFQNDADFNNPATSWLTASTQTLDSNQMPLNTSTNPCLLIMATTGSDGGFYDPGLLTADDLSGNTTVSQGSDSDATASTAGSTIDTANLYNSSVSIACAPGTTDLGIQDGYTGGQLVKIRICSIPNLPSSGEESTPGSAYYINNANGQAVVNSRVSGAVLAMVNAAKSSHVTLTASSSFRTMAHQQALCAANSLCVSGDYSRVAKPGTSNHQMGLAIDFAGLPSSAGPVTGNPIWDWLSANALNFGYKNYPAEAWHWSPTGN
jgi:hypothetical protein